VTAEWLAETRTSAKVNGKKWWVWVWQNVLNTYLKVTDNRASQTIEAEWSNGFPKAVMVTDRYAAQLKTISRGKQLCLAHLLRDVKYLREKEGHWVSEEFEKFIKDVFREKKKLVEKNRALERESEAAKGLENRLNEKLKEVIVEEKYPESAKFQKAMIKYRNNLLVCVYEKEVPADNNGSERAIRNVKVKQKVSGQFKSGQESFCVLRSVIDTLIKRKPDVLTYLNQIMQIQPE
jgi:transposase